MQKPLYPSSTDRRRFLQRSVQAAATLYLPTYLSCNPTKQDSATAQQGVEPPSRNRKLGVALLGLGGYSRGVLAPALQLTKYCELRGIITGSPEKIPIWQQQYGIPDVNVYSYDNMPQIANNDAIDVVYIVTPTATHARFAIAAAAAGKHVWCEKPMAMTVEECASIMRACEDNKVRLSIGYRMQHEPNTQKVRSYASTLPYGPIQSLRAEAGYGGAIPKSGWRSRPEMGGGALYDMGVYTINGLRYATVQEPLRVLSATSETPREVDVTTAYQLEFPGGIIAQGRTSVVENINWLRVNCQDGWYELSPMQTYSGVQGRTSDGTLLNQPIPNQQARQMDDDALAILNNTPAMVPGREGLLDIRIVQAILLAAKTGGVIAID